MVEHYIELIKEQLMMNQFSTHPHSLKEITKQLTMEHLEDQLEIQEAYEQINKELFELPIL
jgi:hypothetical protein